MAATVELCGLDAKAFLKPLALRKERLVDVKQVFAAISSFAALLLDGQAGAA